MAAPSRPPTWKAHNVTPVCSGCGRRLSYEESLWFQSLPFPAVWGFACCALVNRRQERKAA